MKYTSYNNRVVQEHKRNMKILSNILMLIDINNIKHHMRLLNCYHKHISIGMFSSLTIVRQYKLNNIQLRVLYNSMLFNGHIK